ncbi:hypothetical protein [Paracidovorax konjaci]|uniref:hypothetical protein n=1 Tax=Paracidovorax konjaci TaxID=32040 RepID=UPI0011142276|nr:hypothetical protein [Paracidovorax konjaci]
MSNLNSLNAAHSGTRKQIPTPQDSASPSRQLKGTSPPAARTRLSPDGPLAGLDSLRRQSPPNDGEAVRHRAANTIIRATREHIANKAAAEMFAKGSMWEHAAQVLVWDGVLKNVQDFSLKNLSSANLSKLRQRLGQLNTAESAMFDAFTQQKFFATHFTNANLLEKPLFYDRRISPFDHLKNSVIEQLQTLWNGFLESTLELPEDESTRLDKGPTMALYSRQRLTNGRIGFDRKNTTESDIFTKGDDNAVFFALECGKTPSKLSSRFGKSLYRVPFDEPVFEQVAWGALDDLLDQDDEDRSVFNRMKDSIEHRMKDSIEPAEYEAFKAVHGHPNRLCHEHGSSRRYIKAQAMDYDDIFIGKDLIAGTALSIIHKLRTVNAMIHANGEPNPSHDNTPINPIVAKLLASRDANEINGLMRIFHSPEIRVPGHFFSKNFQKFDPEEITHMSNVKKDQRHLE